VNICLLGASGRVGSIILENILNHHHQVRALVRVSKKLNKLSTDLTIIEGNVLNEVDVASCMNGSDVVISALNTGGCSTISQSMEIIIKMMKKQGIKRIVTIGTAGILQSCMEPCLYRFQSSESKRKTTRDAEDHLKAYLQLKDSTLDWTIVCPTYLPIGERIGIYRYQKDILPENATSISVYDTGDFTYQQLFTNEFIGYRVGLTY
jgi:uncharacterized protein